MSVDRHQKTDSNKWHLKASQEQSACSALNSTRVKKLTFIPQRLQPHVQMHPWIPCPHSSALNFAPTKKSIFRNAQLVLMSMQRQCGTGMYVFLWHVSLWHLIIIMQVLFVAPQVQLARPHSQSTTPGAKPAHSRPVRLLGNIGLFFCCACNHQHTDGDALPTQQPQRQS